MTGDDRIIAPARPPLVLWVALLLAGAWGPLSLTLLDLVQHDGLLLPHASTWFGRDFTNLWLGGRSALDQHLNVYDQDQYLPALHAAGIPGWQNYSYPPFTLAIGALLGRLPYLVALALWCGGGLACFVLAARRFVAFPWPWLLLIPPAAGFLNGQYGLFAAAMWLWAYRGSGVAAGLLTLKPHLGLLLAPALLLKRRWREALIAAAVALAMWGIGEALFGLTRQFFSEGARIQLLVLTATANNPYFAAMPSTFVRLRHSGIAWPAHIAVSLAAVALLWPLRRRALSELAFPLATATFLILPYSFPYDMAVVSLGFAHLLYSRWGSLSTTERAIAAGAYLAGNVPMLAPPLLLAGLWLQSRQPPGQGDQAAAASSSPTASHSMHSASAPARSSGKSTSPHCSPAMS